METHKLKDADESSEVLENLGHDDVKGYDAVIDPRVLRVQAWLIAKNLIESKCGPDAVTRSIDAVNELAEEIYHA